VEANVGPWPIAFAIVAIVLALGLLLVALLPKRISHKSPFEDLQAPFGPLEQLVVPQEQLLVAAAPRNWMAKAASEPRAPEVPGSKRDIIARMEAARGSRVIAVIHRDNMERKHLDVVDLEDALTAIRKVPRNKPLDVIIHSPGGHIRAGQQIARAIKAHPAKTTVFVPYYALGSATFIAYAADQIVMSPHAALSPFDPYVSKGTASSILNGITDKPISKIEDETIICADISRKLLNEARRVSCELMDDGDDYAGVCRIADELVSGKWSSDRAITPADAKEVGLKVSSEMPPEVYQLIRSCRRSRGRDASVATSEVERSRFGAATLRGEKAESSPVGIYDDVRQFHFERSSAAKAVPEPKQKLTWLAQSGTYVPEGMADRAKGIIKQIEQQRGSRVICIIHGRNMEREAFNFEDLEDTLGALVSSDPTKPLDIILHTQGGSSFTGRQIARAVKSHRARKTVFVPYYAMSAGTRISLAADQIVMGPHATLGPIDTQLYGWPAPSILRLLEVKPADAISDEFLILAEEARKIIIEGRATACDLLQGTYSNDGSCAIADEMMSGKWTHGFGITAEIAQNLGLNVSTDLPDLFFDLIRCFRHGEGEEPSVICGER
jgi:ClpP class serine protease